MEEDIEFLKKRIELNKQMYLEFGRLLSLDDETVTVIENLINKYKEQEKMIKLMAKDIEKITGSCPFDLHNYQVEDCDNICQMLADNGQQYTCFIEYYEKKAR